MAVLGAALARGGEHHDAFVGLGVEDWRTLIPTVDAAFAGFREGDLYPDARSAIADLRERGYRVAVIGNQPASRGPELRALGIEPDAMAMSDDLGVTKPDPAFFARALDVMGSPAAADVVYVGDRLDNDVVPSKIAGMHPVWIRRGPWAAIQAADPRPDARPALIVDSLVELVERIDEAWR